MQENEIGRRWGVGWRQPGEVLDALRSTYPVMRGLSICVSGTILPCMIEEQLWGKPKLPEVDTRASGGAHPFPTTTTRSTLARGRQWFDHWDLALVRANESYERFARFANPVLCSALTPPRGRIANVDRLPEWVRRGDPDNVDTFYDMLRNTDVPPLGRTYYGTMQHVVQWDGGPLTLLYGDRIPSGFSRGPPVQAPGGVVVDIDAAMRGRGMPGGTPRPPPQSRRAQTSTGRLAARRSSLCSTTTCAGARASASTSRST